MGRENEYNFGKLHHSETFWEMFNEYLHPEKDERGSRIKNITQGLALADADIIDLQESITAIVSNIIDNLFAG